MFLSTFKVLLIPFTKRTAHAQTPYSHNGLYVNRNAASVRTVLWRCLKVGGASQVSGLASMWAGPCELGKSRAARQTVRRARAAHVPTRKNTVLCTPKKVVLSPQMIYSCITMFTFYFKGIYILLLYMKPKKLH